MRSDGKWGYIDATGGSLIPPAFNAASAFSGGLAAQKVLAAAIESVKTESVVRLEE